MALKQINKIDIAKNQTAAASSYAATTAINSVMLSQKGADKGALHNSQLQGSKLTNNEFVNTSLMSTTAKQRQGRNQYHSNVVTQPFNRSMLMTPDANSRGPKGGNHFGFDPFEKKRGSVNIKDMKIQLNNAREKLKSQGHNRGARNIMKSPDHQGGFHSGFFEQQNTDQWADIHVSATKKQIMSQRDVRQVKTSHHKRSYSNDPSIMEMISVGQKNTFNLLNPKFGVKGYSVQQTSMFEPYYKIQNITTSKRKNKENYIEEYIKANSWKKGAQYNVLYDWTKTQPQWRGAFLKGPKISSTESVILENKRRPKPGPGIYPITNNIYDNLKKNSSKVSSDVKDCGFIEHSKVKSAETPGHKYNKSYSQVDKKLKNVYIHKESEKSKDFRIGKIPTDKTAPAMGDYDVQTAFKKSQLGNREYILPKDKLQCYTDIYKNKKKFVPGPAQYKVELSAFDKLSASPVGIRVRRH